MLSSSYFSLAVTKLPVRSHWRGKGFTLTHNLKIQSSIMVMKSRWQEVCEAACSHPREQESKDQGAGVKSAITPTPTIQQGPLTPSRSLHLLKVPPVSLCRNHTHITTNDLQGQIFHPHGRHTTKEGLLKSCVSWISVTSSLFPL